MKHIFIAAIAAMAFSTVCLAAPQPKLLIELNGIYNGLTLSETSGAGFAFTTLQNNKIKNAKSFYYATGTQPITKDWKEYSISFIPNVKTLTLGFRSTSASAGNWIDIDDIKVVNGSIKNPSFEAINSKQEAACWRYYAPDCVRANKKDAADGKNYITVNSNFAMRTSGRVIETGYSSRFS